MASLRLLSHSWSALVNATIGLARAAHKRKMGRFALENLNVCRQPRQPLRQRSTSATRPARLYCGLGVCAAMAHWQRSLRQGGDVTVLERSSFAEPVRM